MSENQIPEFEKNEEAIDIAGGRGYDLGISKGDIVSFPNNASDLEIYSKAIAKRAFREEITPLSDLEKLLEFQEKLEKIRENRYRQRIGTILTLARVVGGFSGMIIGVILTESSSLLGPLLITMGLSGVVGYSLRDVSELLSTMQGRRIIKGEKS